MSISELEREEAEAWGESPPGLDRIPGVINLDQSSSPQGLEKKAKEFLKAHPHIFSEAKRLGQDLVAHCSSHGRGIIIGVGVASTAIALALGAIIIYKHQRKE